MAVAGSIEQYTARTPSGAGARPSKEVRTFATTRQELFALRDWLHWRHPHRDIARRGDLPTIADQGTWP
jgi:hypothetical protein